MPTRTSPTRLRVTSPAPRSTWRELLAVDDDALVSQSPEWVDALCATEGYEDASRLYETRAGACLVLPMVRRTGPWPTRLSPQASMPHAWGMGGLLAEAVAEPADVAPIVADLASEAWTRTGIRPNPLHADLWAKVSGPGIVAIPGRAHVIDLSGGADEAWGQLKKSARAGVRGAERCGVEIECDTSGRLLSVFHELLELSIERWARQQNEPPRLARWRGRRRDPLYKFERMAAALGDAMRVWVAWKDGEPAASIVVLRGTNASYTRGAMNKDLAGPTRANDLLQWFAIKDACGAGCRSYHMGESGSSRSLSHFKEKFGARPVPYAEYRIERLPLTRADAIARGLVKRLLRFRDA